MHFGQILNFFSIRWKSPLQKIKNTSREKREFIIVTTCQSAFVEADSLSFVNHLGFLRSSTHPKKTRKTYLIINIISLPLILSENKTYILVKFPFYEKQINEGKGKYVDMCLSYKRTSMSMK